jgi:hypothetical protein
LTTTAFILSILVIGALGYLWYLVRSQQQKIIRLNHRIADMELEEAINKKFRERDPEWNWPPREEMKD